MKEKLEVGKETHINGRWVMVNEISDGYAWCLDEDGREFAIAVDENNFRRF